MYRSILKQSWNIVRKSKILIFLGLFAAVLGNGGAFEVLFKSYDDITTSGERLSALLKSFFSLSVTNTAFWLNIADTIKNNTTGFVITATSFLLIFIIICTLIWFIILSQAALIVSVPQSVRGKKFTLRSLYSQVKGHFWPVFGINLLTKLGAIIFLLATGVFILSPFSQSENIIGTFFLFLIFFAINIIANIIFYFLGIYANAYLLLQGAHFTTALTKGYHLFRMHWLSSLEMAAVLFIVNIAASLLAFIASVLLSLPFFLFFVLSILSQHTAIAMINGILIFLIFLFIFLVVGGFLGAYQTTCWILFFQKISSGKITAVLKNLFQKYRMKRIS